MVGVACDEVFLRSLQVGLQARSPLAARVTSCYAPTCAGVVGAGGPVRVGHPRRSRHLSHPDRRSAGSLGAAAHRPTHPTAVIRPASANYPRSVPG